MIEFEKISQEEMNVMKQIIQKNVEKSELEKLFLFTNDLIEKCKIFVYGYSFLRNLHNLLDKGETKNLIIKELNYLNEVYEEISHNLSKLENKINFGEGIIKRKLFSLVESTNHVNDLIDSLSILIERVNIIQIAKVKGFLLEGKSGEEYKKIFDKDKEKEFRKV